MKIENTRVSEAAALAGNRTELTLRDAAVRKFRHIARLTVAAAVLGMAQSTVCAGTITSFGPVSPLGCSNTPSPSTSGNAFGVSLGVGVNAFCTIDYNWNGAGAATLYPMTFTVTNNTGQDMTDLHVVLASAAAIPPFFSGAAVISGPLVLVGQTSTTMDFNWASTKLLNGGTEVISFNLTLPLSGQSGQDGIGITPTFNTAPVPEPATSTLAMSGAVLVSLAAWRRLRRSA